MIIDLEGEESQILVNPKMPSKEQEEAFSHIKQYFTQLPAHVWLATSGSTGSAKWVALSKKALLTSAKAVNAHLQSTAKDCWINPLPYFHVGGLGIYARSYLAKSKMIAYEEKWNPHTFVLQANANQATLSSLVPTQLYDIVKEGLTAPKSLRAIIIGGGSLSFFSISTRYGTRMETAPKLWINRMLFTSGNSGTWKS